MDVGAGNAKLKKGNRVRHVVDTNVTGTIDLLQKVGMTGVTPATKLAEQHRKMAEPGKG